MTLDFRREAPRTEGQPLAEPRLRARANARSVRGCERLVILGEAPQARLRARANARSVRGCERKDQEW